MNNIFSNFPGGSNSKPFPNVTGGISSNMNTHNNDGSVPSNLFNSPSQAPTDEIRQNVLGSEPLTNLNAHLWSKEPVYEVDTYQIAVPNGDCSVHLLVQRPDNYRDDGPMPLGTIKHSILMDGGNDGGHGANVAASIIRKSLQVILRKYTQTDDQFPDGVIQFDAWVVTHWDNDHWAGTYEMLRKSETNLGPGTSKYFKYDEVTKEPKTILYCPNWSQHSVFSTDDNPNDKLKARPDVFLLEPRPGIDERIRYMGGQGKVYINAEDRESDVYLCHAKWGHRMLLARDFFTGERVGNAPPPSLFKGPKEDRKLQARFPTFDVLQEKMLGKNADEHRILQPRFFCIGVAGFLLGEHINPEILAKAMGKKKSGKNDTWANFSSIISVLHFPRKKHLSLYWAGDAVSYVEERLVAKRPNIGGGGSFFDGYTCSVAKWSHHGSHHSNPIALWRGLGVKKCVVSPNHNGTYLHPHPDVIVRFYNYAATNLWPQDGQQQTTAPAVIGKNGGNVNSTLIGSKYPDEYTEYTEFTENATNRNPETQKDRSLENNTMRFVKEPVQEEGTYFGDDPLDSDDEQSYNLSFALEEKDSCFEEEKETIPFTERYAGNNSDTIAGQLRGFNHGDDGDISLWDDPWDSEEEEAIAVLEHPPPPRTTAPVLFSTYFPGWMKKRESFIKYETERRRRAWNPDRKATPPTNATTQWRNEANSKMNQLKDAWARLSATGQHHVDQDTYVSPEGNDLFQMRDGRFNAKSDFGEQNIREGREISYQTLFLRITSSSDAERDGKTIWSYVAPATAAITESEDEDPYDDRPVATIHEDFDEIDAEGHKILVIEDVNLEGGKKTKTTAGTKKKPTSMKTTATNNNNATTEVKTRVDRPRKGEEETPTALNQSGARVRGTMNGKGDGEEEDDEDRVKERPGGRSRLKDKDDRKQNFNIQKAELWS